MKKTIAFLLCLTLCLGLLAGCGNTAASSAEPASAASAAESVGTESGDAQAAAVASETEPTEGTISYPLSNDGTAELDYWLPFYSFIWSGYFDTFNDAPITPVLEEKTGVHINFREVSGESVNETFNLMLASDDLPDMFALTDSLSMQSLYVGGAVRAAHEGIILDLTDLLEKNAPDYYNLINTMDDYTKRFLFTEDNRVLQIYQLNDKYVPEGGLGIRTDWMQELGYDSINTIDELTGFLKDAQAKYNPMYTLWLDTDAIADNIVGAFGTVGYQLDGSDILWQQANDVLEAGFATEGYRAYVEWLIDLYDSNIINQDFYNNSESREQSTVMADGDIAAIPNIAADGIDNVMKEFTDPNAAVDGYAPITGNDYTFKELSAALGRNTMVISTACDTPELALQYLNYGFTPEGSVVCNYGEEGVTFEYDDNGDPQYTEYITNNPDHAPMAIRNTINDVITPFLYFREAMFFTYSDRALAAMGDDVWGQGSSESVVPSSNNLSFTSDESVEYSALVSDLTTYAGEQIGKWIIGGEELNDDSWNAYLDKLEAMGLSKATEIAQSGYNTFWGLS